VIVPLGAAVYAAAGLSDEIEIVLAIADLGDGFRCIPDDPIRRRRVIAPANVRVFVTNTVRTCGARHQRVVGVALIIGGRQKGCSVGLDPR
jgi:hypothetical protein